MSENQQPPVGYSMIGCAMIVATVCITAAILVGVGVMGNTSRPVQSSTSAGASSTKAEQPATKSGPTREEAAQYASAASVMSDDMGAMSSAAGAGDVDGLGSACTVMAGDAQRFLGLPSLTPEFDSAWTNAMSKINEASTLCAEAAATGNADELSTAAAIFRDVNDVYLPRVKAAMAKFTPTS